jgi:hippurate hydrolase
VISVTALVSDNHGTALLAVSPTSIRPLESDDKSALADAAASLVGEAAVERNRTPVMGSEDFAYMLLQRPGA